MVARPLAAIGALTSLVLAASACTTSQGGESQPPAFVGHFLGVPQHARVPAVEADPRQMTPVVLRAPRPGSIYLITWGSSTCPLVPAYVLVAGRQHVVIRTVSDDLVVGNTPCADDLAATTSIVRLPPAIDSSGAVDVTVDGHRLELPARR